MSNLAKERLTRILDEMENPSFNLKKLSNRFGAENLKRLPFDRLNIDMGSNGSDGNHYLEVNLTTGKAQRYCTISDIDNNLILKENHLDLIEKEIFSEIKKYK